METIDETLAKVLGIPSWQVLRSNKHISISKDAAESLLRMLLMP
jgi:hypothetical protein